MTPLEKHCLPQMAFYKPNTTRILQFSKGTVEVSSKSEML